MQRRSFMKATLALMAGPVLVTETHAARMLSAVPVDPDLEAIRETVRLYGENVRAIEAARTMNVRGTNGYPLGDTEVTQGFDRLLTHMMISFSEAPCDKDAVCDATRIRDIQVTEDRLLDITRGAIPVLVVRRVLGVHKAPVMGPFSRQVAQWEPFVQKYARVLPTVNNGG